MCYPSVSLIDPFHSGNGRAGPRNLVSPMGTVAQQMVVRQHNQRPTTAIARITGREGGGGADGGVVKQCICSPTTHPGSFRCRYHLTEYQWVGRLGPKSS
ncbi:hypothetical protein ACH5RR_024520 [Cinchona calisaya]|uniref:Uncharacterized protein n=1 Tax=Cinchona calisaya TaxID=153742 RepID=A0ABD2Z1Z5_9GENT